MNRNAAQAAGQIIGQIEGRQVVGLDIAKSAFQLHSVDMSTGKIINVQLKRARVLEHFANQAPCLIGIEACGGAHHWARELAARGHIVRLIHGTRSMLAHTREPGPWLERLKARRPAGVVIVAQAAKMARTLWAVTTHQQDYRRGWRSSRPQAA
jgi:transposase